MTSLCVNGHVTGRRKCGTCGADRTNQRVGLGFVSTPKHLLDRSESEWWKIRHETRAFGGPKGPNKVHNGEYEPTPIVPRMQL